MNRGGKSSGQALLIILLVLSVALTTGLALVARTTTDISISEKETASSKAFEAAEAGIEEALKKIEAGELAIDDELILEPGGEKTTVQIKSVVGGEVTKRQIFSGQATTFWLNRISLEGKYFPADDINYNGTALTFCWSGANNLEVAVYYQSGGYKVARNYLNNTGGGDCSGEFGILNGKKVTFTLPSSLPTDNKFVNVRFYGGASEVVTVAAEGAGGASLPKHGTTVEAEATVGDVVRKVRVSQGWPQAPQFFDFAVLSAGGLTKTD